MPCHVCMHSFYDNVTKINGFLRALKANISCYNGTQFCSMNIITQISFDDMIYLGLLLDLSLCVILCNYDESELY